MAPRRRTAKKISASVTSIEPGSLTVPTMDRPSIAFAWFLDNMQVGVVENTDDPVLFCTLCLGVICSVEHGDTLRVLLNTALAHDCASHP